MRIPRWSRRRASSSEVPLPPPGDLEPLLAAVRRLEAKVDALPIEVDFRASNARSPTAVEWLFVVVYVLALAVATVVLVNATRNASAEAHLSESLSTLRGVEAQAGALTRKEGAIITEKVVASYEREQNDHAVATVAAAVVGALLSLLVVGLAQFVLRVGRINRIAREQRKRLADEAQRLVHVQDRASVSLEE
jgi:hypothetical protein